MRVSLDLGFSRNSLSDAPYFNPSHDLTFSVTPMIEQTVRRMYRRAFIHRLFLSVGGYDQAGFGTRPIASLRYQQEYEFSDTQALLWGFSLSRNVYDGRPVGSYSFYATYRGRF
jgi:biofilm PGA synthesis protein PgaA